MREVMTYQSISLIIAVTSLLVALAAAWIAKSSLSQANQVAQRDQKDWRQRKWFDLYFKADGTYDALDRFHVLYTSTSTPSWGTKEWEAEWNDLMHILRRVHAMALVFPKNPVINELLSATAVFKDPEQAVSKERLEKVLNAVEGVRQKALVDATVL